MLAILFMPRSSQLQKLLFSHWLRNLQKFVMDSREMLNSFMDLELTFMTVHRFGNLFMNWSSQHPKLLHFHWLTIFVKVSYLRLQPGTRNQCMAQSIPSLWALLFPVHVLRDLNGRPRNKRRNRTCSIAFHCEGSRHRDQFKFFLRQELQR